ncbi:MAG: tyrosine-type recombinase/integrase, partial [Lachnospiraceae bacterium]|nr:tyrosine-type recombinase/integrase [Lachnospiraceae bacterium]
KRIYTNYNADEIVAAAREGRPPVLIPHFSCHHLRHTFCTRFCEHETNVKVIQSIMGHADISTTMDIYAEVSDAKKHDAMSELSTKYDIF